MAAALVPDQADSSANRARDGWADKKRETGWGCRAGTEIKEVGRRGVIYGRKPPILLAATRWAARRLGSKSDLPPVPN